METNNNTRALPVAAHKWLLSDTHNTDPKRYPKHMGKSLCCDDGIGDKWFVARFEDAPPELVQAVFRACNSHAALVAALELLVSFDDQQGMADHIRERSGNNEDAQTPEETIYLHGMSAAHAALALAKETTQ